jgi:hypothetical protein
MLFTGCGLKVGAIRSVDAAKSFSVGRGIVVGKVQFIVDGQNLQYNIFNRPLMRLFRFLDNNYYETPLVEATGAFSWELPAGEYEIAMLGGGMSPVKQRMLMRNSGKYWQVNGFTYPGYRFVVTSGKIHYLGTLAVDVNSRAMNAVIDFTGERVFDSLNRMLIVDESETDPKWQLLKGHPGAVIELLEPTTPQSKTNRN